MEDIYIVVSGEYQVQNSIEKYTEEKDSGLMKRWDKKEKTVGLALLGVGQYFGTEVY